jgi:hypothetical protein
MSLLPGDLGAGSAAGQACDPATHVCANATNLHYENPIFTVVLTVPVRQPLSTIGAVGTGWNTPVPSRVPDDGTRIAFTLVGGFHALALTLSSVDAIAQLPRTAITGPDGTTLYVVDEGRQAVGTGLRGQVLRFFTDSQSNDVTFSVR